MSSDVIGATIDGGLADWQIVQRDDRGVGSVALQGRWGSADPVAGEAPGVVQVRVVHETTGTPVSSSLDWTVASTSADGTWRASLEIPAGGLYRLETRYSAADQEAAEWSTRGDMRHFVGVGDLWVIAGQSNSAGYGRGAVDDAPVLGVHVLRNSEQWALAAHPLNESTDSAHPVNREGGNPGHSPYLQVGRRLQATLGHPIGLIQTALGGSPLSAWNPTESSADTAVLFENMTHCVQLAGGRVRGIFWYQGESDANADDAPTYADRFASAVAAWRTALDDPALPIVTVQLNRVVDQPGVADDLGWSIVREAQRQIAHADDRVFVVPALDLPLSDPIHTSAAGNMVLAERLAAAALGGVAGRGIAYRAPDISSAEHTAEHAVVLRFADVTSRLAQLDLSAAPFRIDDVEGDVPIVEVGYPDDDVVVLTLGRSLAGSAVVSGGGGAAPAPVPIDVERAVPMLGFHAVAITEGRSL